MPTVERRPWRRDELLAAFCLYCRTPFGKLHQRNQEIIRLAKALERTPSAVAMKACNFASLDPVVQGRGVSGLGNVSRGDRDLWDEFEANSTAIADEAETVFETLVVNGQSDPAFEVQIPTGPTESLTVVRMRRVQAFFRASVLTSYEYRCAITGIEVPELGGKSLRLCKGLGHLAHRHACRRLRDMPA